jgi:hypothetical protein
MSDFKLYSVNWQDGMLITQRHLKDQEDFFENLARWYAQSGGDAYGLVSRNGQHALSLNVSQSGGRVKVEVVRCEAVTADGSYIEINESTAPTIKAEGEIAEGRIPVYLAVERGAKQQVGEADPEEEVPRLPYLSPGYSLHVGTPPSGPENSYLQLAELVAGGAEIAPATDFYPPCMSLYADANLYQQATDFRNRLETLLALASRAHMAVVTENALAGEKTELQVAFRETLHQLVYHLAANLDGFVIGRNAGHPIQMVLTFKRLFRVFSASLNLYPGLKDYLNEKLFVKVLKADLRQFVSSLDSFLLAEYDHRNLGVHVTAIAEILGTLKRVMEFLGQVKSDQLGAQAVATDMLTYRGKTYRLVDHTACRLEQMGELSYLIVDAAEARKVGDCAILISKDLYSQNEWLAMQIRLGLNEARALGETDPVDIDTTTYGNKVALHPRDMFEMSGVKQYALMFRGAFDPQKMADLGKMDIQIYAV